MSILNLLQGLPTGRVWDKYLASHFLSDAAYSSVNTIDTPGDIACFGNTQGYMFGFRNNRYEFIPSLDGLPRTSSIHEYDSLNSQIIKSLQDSRFTSPTMLAWDPDRNFYDKMIDHAPIALCDQPGRMGTIRLRNFGSDVIEPNQKIGLFFPSQQDRNTLQHIFGVKNTVAPLVTRHITSETCDYYRLQNFIELRKKISANNRYYNPREFQYLAKLGLLLNMGLPVHYIPRLIDHYLGIGGESARGTSGRRGGRGGGGDDDDDNAGGCSKRQKRDEDYVESGQFTELEVNRQSYRGGSGIHGRSSAYEESVGGVGKICLTGCDGLALDDQRALNYMTSVKTNPLVQDIVSFQEERKTVTEQEDKIMDRLRVLCTDLYDHRQDTDVDILRNLCQKMTTKLNGKRDGACELIQDSVDDVIVKLDSTPLEKFSQVRFNTIRSSSGQTSLHKMTKLHIFQTMLQLCGLDEDDVGKIVLLAKDDHDIYTEINKLTSVVSQSVYDIGQPIHHIGYCRVGEDPAIFNKCQPGKTFQLEPIQGEVKVNMFSIPTVYF